MFAAACLALGFLASAIQWGWQPLTDGGREYIVQVEPQLSDLDTFRKEGFSSDIPPQLRDIRRIRIVVGSDPLPNQGEIPAAPAPLPAGVSAAPLHSAPLNSGPQNSGPQNSGPQNSAPNTAGETDVPSNRSQPAAPVGPLAGQESNLPAANPPRRSHSGVTLTDGHQPEAADGSQPTHQPSARVADNSTPRSPSDKLPEGSRAGDAAAAPSSAAPSSAAAATAASSAAAPRPWFTLLLVAAGLIISLSGNVFLGWIHWDTRHRYQALVSKLRGERNSAAAL